MLCIPCIAQTISDNDWIIHTNGNSVRAFEEDGNYMWIGTNDGLVKHNMRTGKQQHFTRYNSPLPSNHIFCLEKDKSGNIWAGTGKGLVKFDGQNWIVYTSANSGLVDGALCEHILADRNNVIWICQSLEGVVSFDGKTWKWYNYKNIGITSDNFFSMAIDSLNRKWFGSWYSLLCYNDTVWTEYSQEHGIPVQYNTGIAVDKDNLLWVTSFPTGMDYNSTGGGLGTFDGSVWQEINSRYYYCDVVVDSKGNKWINSGDLLLYNNQGLTIFDSTNSINFDGNLDYLFLGSKNRLFMGTDSGFLVLGQHGRTRYTTTQSGIPYNTILSIAIDSFDNAWILFENKSHNYLYMYNGYSWTAQAEDLLNWNTRPHTVVVAPDSHVWMLCDSFAAEYDNSAWRQIYCRPSPDTHLAFRSVTFDTGGVYWFGTSNGFCKYNGYWSHYRLPGFASPVNTMIFDPKDHGLWIGSDYYGLYHSNDTGIVHCYNPDMIEDIRDILIDSSGTKWISSTGRKSHGIGKYEQSGSSVVFSPGSSGMPDYTATSMVFDEQHQLWFGTKTKGLCMYDGTSWTSLNDTNSWLPSSRMNDIVIDRHGNKWLGTSNGLAIIRAADSNLAVETAIAPATPELVVYPNPFNPIVTIKYSIKPKEQATLEILDTHGRTVKHLKLSKTGDSQNSVQWDGRDNNCNIVSNGVYFIRLKSLDRVSTSKAILLR